MKKGCFSLILLIAVGLAIAVIATSSGDTPQQEKAKIELTARAVRDAVAASLPSIPYTATLNTTSVRPTSIAMVLDYASLPDFGLVSVQTDTKRVARAVLGALVKAGRDPSKEGINVIVHGEQPVKGETGQPLVRRFGYTYYDYNNDSLIYVRP